MRLIPARGARPYVRGDKTDHHDVAGMLEADRSAAIREVPVKTPEQGIHVCGRSASRDQPTSATTA